MTIWRIEQKFISKMGEARWLAVLGGYQRRDEAEAVLTRMVGRGPEKRAARPEYRIVELPE